MTTKNITKNEMAKGIMEWINFQMINNADFRNMLKNSETAEEATNKALLAFATCNLIK